MIEVRLEGAPLLAPKGKEGKGITENISRNKEFHPRGEGKLFYNRQ